jgi:hypothetical protein
VFEPLPRSQDRVLQSPGSLREPPPLP